MMSLLTRGAYVRDLRPELPAQAFERAPSRLAFMGVYFVIATSAIVAVALGAVPWFLLPVASIVIGCSFAGMTFVGHELMHGAILRNKRLQLVFGWLGFLPFIVSPRLWVAWHNVTHHALTNLPTDPDVYPTLDEYHSRPGARFAIDWFSLGARRWRGLLSIVLGFTGQSIDQLRGARKRGYMSPSQHRRAIAETALGVAFWLVVAFLVGFVPFLFVFGIPLLVANACVMMFILTNHSLSPRADVNDPLINSLTVTTPRVIDFLTLGFGYHVEHHLFPAMSTRHAPKVRAVLLKLWPDRYQSMPLVEALQKLHATARVYQTSTTLFDPKTGTLYATLAPRGG
jgi:fatty acid desaturase